MDEEGTDLGWGKQGMGRIGSRKAVSGIVLIFWVNEKTLKEGEGQGSRGSRDGF